MAFQRSYSKVWWGSDYQTSYLTLENDRSLGKRSTLHTPATAAANKQDNIRDDFKEKEDYRNGPEIFERSLIYHSLDLNHNKCYNGNLSCIQEAEDECNISKISWPKHNSPGSLRSQDSGFSDNEDIVSNRSGRSFKCVSPSKKKSPPRTQATSINESPASNSSSSITPPTVIKRHKKSTFYVSLVNVSRRINFSPNTEPRTSGYTQLSHTDDTEDGVEEGMQLLNQLDNMKLSVDASPADSQLAGKASTMTKHSIERDDILNSSNEVSALPEPAAYQPVKPKRRKHYKRAISEMGTVSTLPINQTSANNFELPASANETAPEILKSPPSYNNETVILGGLTDRNGDSSLGNDTFADYPLSPLQAQGTLNTKTSTPKRQITQIDYEQFAEDISKQDNRLQNGHSADLLSWLGHLRCLCYEEVMYTFQTKSIAQQTQKKFTITTHMVAKLIRQLQQRCLHLHAAFERVERMLSSRQQRPLSEALVTSTSLLDLVDEFMQMLKRRTVFFAECRRDRNRFEDYLDQIRIVNKDTRYSLNRQHYINLDSLLEDIQVLKRNMLITIRLVFEKFVGILVQNVEKTSSSCDMMLRANLNMIATLMNIDYDGFASLIDAFVQTDAVRTLLIICLDNKIACVRALALRALATICCAPEPIAQLVSNGGLEILCNTLQVQNIKQRKSSSTIKRSQTEQREAVSLLTQITAAWHGEEHKIPALRDNVEVVIEGITEMIVLIDSPQTLLLCAAALNNLSRLEITAHYSIMAHESITKLMEAIERQQQIDNERISIFLYEQIVSMLHNMSMNKKCHSHLANANVINFITFTFRHEFYRCYSGRGESEAQQRTINNILHTLLRLTQQSVLGMELLEQTKQQQPEQQQPEQNRPQHLILDGSSGSDNSDGSSSSTQQRLLIGARLFTHNQVQSPDISAIVRHLLHAPQQSPRICQTQHRRRQSPQPLHQIDGVNLQKSSFCQESSV